MRSEIFDRFRSPRTIEASASVESASKSLLSPAIDRGVGIGRFGVEKATFDFCTEMYGAPAKNCSGPENRDASILLGKLLGNAMIFSIAFFFEEHGGLQPRGRAADRPDPPGRRPDLLQLRGLAHRAALHRGRAVVRSSACRVVP